MLTLSVAMGPETREMTACFGDWKSAYYFWYCMVRVDYSATNHVHDSVPRWLMNKVLWYRFTDHNGMGVKTKMVKGTPCINGLAPELQVGVETVVLAEMTREGYETDWVNPNKNWKPEPREQKPDDCRVTKVSQEKNTW